MHPIHRRFHAEELVRLRRAGEKRRYVAAQRRGRVDPNPHQIEAVTFALKRIPEGGCILADEVGLGKTIEAGLVIAQLLAEGKSRVLVIVPRPLLGQWQHELRGLFGIEALEAADDNVDVAAPGVFLAGREYAGGERGFVRLRQAPPFDLCLIDEAHEVFAGIHRRYNKDGSYDEASPHARTAHRVKQLLGISPVLLLTATPMQNSLDELWALVGYIDRTGTLLGDKPTFDALFKSEGDVGAEQAGELQRRLKQVVQRTLRRQAMPYLERPFVGREARLYHYTMSAAEKALYDDVTEYLLEPELFAFRGSARKLLLLGFHRRMASSNAALAKSLEGVAARLRKLVGGTPETAEDLDDDLEERLDGDDEGLAPSPAGQTHRQEAPSSIPRPDQAAIRAELDRVESFVRRARALPEDSKAESLVKVVQLVLDRPEDRRKVLIFTESLTTQDYLRDLLVRKTPLTEQDITLFRGVNDSPRAGMALRVWREQVEAETAPHLRPGPSAAVRLALVHEFENRSTVMIATEAGAKGLNMQFCDTIVNYDLPWNPQRIEQRIGRCHRYRQQRDVTVFNFLAEDNEAQQLTFDILSGKLDLFGKVLDMTDVVLQTPRSDSSEALTSALGADFETEVRRIWERARSVDDVVAELRQLRDTMEERRRELDRTRERTIGLIEQRLDASVRQVFERIQDELAPSLKALDAELKGVLTAYLDAEEVPWGEGERDGREVLHYGASARLPQPLRSGGTVLIGSSRGLEGADPLHVGHPLIEAAVQRARQQCAGEYRVRFRLQPSAPAALRKHRGSRGRLALTRIRYDGFEPEDRLRVTAVFDDAEVLRPADAALELLRQPCEDVARWGDGGSELANPLAVSAAHLDEVVDEELFEEQGRVADINQQGFEQAMRQLDQYLADRTLVLQRAKRQHSQRLATAERRRDQSVGADNRASAEKRVRDLEANIENVEKQLAALASHDDETYQKWKHHAHQRRYAAPTGERLLSAEFVIE